MLKSEILYLLNDSKHPIVVFAVYYILGGVFVWCVCLIFIFQIRLNAADICKIAYGRVSGGEHSLNKWEEMVIFIYSKIK